MEKGFRIVRCPHCSQKLKIHNITAKQYGKTVEIICPLCGTRMRATIPFPAYFDSFSDGSSCTNGTYAELIDLLFYHKKH